VPAKPTHQGWAARFHMVPRTQRSKNSPSVLIRRASSLANPAIELDVPGIELQVETPEEFSSASSYC